MVIAVDFDGTIVTHAYPLIGQAIGRSVEILRHFREDLKCAVILHTCREPGVGLLEEAVEWCRSKGLEFDAVNENVCRNDVIGKHKLLVDLFIDDRCAGRLMMGRCGDMTPAEWGLIEEQVEAVCAQSGKG